MDELVKLVMDKTGLPKEQARQAVDTVLGFLKQQLPPPIAAQLDAVLGGGANPADLASTLGGLLGGTK